MIHNKISLDISSEQLADIRQQMLKFAQLQLQDIALAEDMVQEAFVNAIKNIDNFQRKAALKTWIFAILKNKIIDYLRKKDRIVLESDLADDDEENHFLIIMGIGKKNIILLAGRKKLFIPKNFGYYLKFA